MKPTLSFSEKVLRRKRERRVAIVFGVGLTFIIVATISAVCVSIYTDIRREKKVSAPNWATFKTATDPGGRVEYVSAVNTDGIPNQLTINGERWDVVKASEFSDNYDTPVGQHGGSTAATTFCNHNAIAYIDTRDPVQLRIHLMHEVFHAGACLHGGDEWWNSENPTPTDHIGVYHLGEFTAIFMHDNPQFASWLAQ